MCDHSTQHNKRSYRKDIMRAALVCSLLTSMLVHAMNYRITQRLSMG